MFYHNLNPVAFSLFGFDVYWYGLLFVTGFIITYFMLGYLAKERHLHLTKSDIDDFIIWAIISVLLGARFVYVLVYNLPYFIANPLHIFFFWEGGLSFHGGLIGFVLMGVIYAKVKKLRFYQLADIVVIPVALSLILGRFANFINGELYGRVTSVPWAFKFPGAEGFRHPSQFYEAFKNFLIFFTLWKVRNKELPEGFMFWMFVTMYGVLRFLIEFVRQPDPQIGANGLFFGWITMGQILCTIMVIVGVFFLVWLWKKHKVNKHNNH